MREHQIVINLKPEQFEELQRLARAAGSKSVNLFVRQKLISTLGLAGPANGSTEDSDAPDLKQLTGELRRLHRELQIFVADSLSNSDYTLSSIEPIPFPTAVQENFLAEGAPLMPESAGFNYRDESPVSLSLNQTVGPDSYLNDPSQSQYSSIQAPGDAQSEFVRPQLPGAFPPSDRAQFSNFQAPITQAATPQPADFGAPPAVSYGQSDSALPPEVNSRVQPAYSLPPDPGAVSPANTAAAQPAFSIPEPPPEASSIPPGLSTSSGVDSNSSQSAPIVVQQFAENDELEDLAERAFAISPRLGQLEEPQKRFPDPLADLLEEALFEDSEDPVDEYSEASQSEPAESVDELAMAAELETEEGQQVQAESEHSDSTVEAANYEAAEIEEPVLEDSEQTIEEESEIEPEEPESSSGADDEPPTDDTPPDPPLQFPPPISGGPPPRKRRT